MSFLLDTGATRWVLDGEWCGFDHAPSTRQLRAVAVQRHAGYFVFKTGTFNQAGFFSLKESFRDTDVNALAWTVAQEKGPLFYGEYLYEKTGNFWVVATDRNGGLLPQSDRFFSGAELQDLRLLLGVEKLAHTEIRSASLEKLCETAHPHPLRMRTVTHTRLIFRTSVTFLGVVLAGASFFAVHSWQDTRKKAETAARQMELLSEQHKQMLAPDRPFPESWIHECLLHVPASFFSGGWTLSSWKCTETGLLLVWKRTGGTVLTAPAGELFSNGNEVRTIFPITFPAERGRQQVANGNSRRELLALLQGLGVEARETGQTGNDDLGSEVSFTLPVSPESVSWNRIPGLALTSMEHETGADGSITTSRNGWQLTAGLVRSGEKKP